MKAKGCKFGIYCVLYFKGQFFSEPRDCDDTGALLLFLQNKRMRAGLDNIRPVILDLSFSRTPSKL
jgi:hypothetical protein